MYELLRLVFLGPPERAETYRLRRFSSRRISVEVQVEVPEISGHAAGDDQFHEELITKWIQSDKPYIILGYKGSAEALRSRRVVPDYAGHRPAGAAPPFNRSLTPNPSLFSPEYIVIDGGYSTHLSKQVSQTMLGSEVADTTQPTRTRSPKLIWTSSKLVPITS
ncbi:acetyl-coa carboxylase [Culex quinquefasciatus]|uniref:Acetyl-coa carboxylase n=1 Tax=Culex quinquefasciatus TaxID=7176 RepID=B0W937_CULQU|nr:acetyl-coa carboxylase [Culex quinquefasciatus]|eukprot:XP_001845221.1 acetyl-coa carboxylase [Culex quinquefasciatus]